MEFRDMKKTRRFRWLLATVVFLLMTGAVTAATTAEKAASYVGVTSVSLEPEVFMQDDTGTIVVEVKNSGSDPVSIARAEILSSEIEVLNYQTYDSVGTIGPGNTMKFTFHVRAGVKDGVYFPMFYLDFTDAGSLRYPIALEVDSTPVSVSVVDAPGSFSPGTKNKVTLSVNNPRKDSVSSVTVTPGGEGIRTTQGSIFIGTLAPDEAKSVTFEVWAEGETDLSFDVSYRNGLNTHHSVLKIPVTIGGRETAAELVVNNVEVTRSGPLVTISGDVTNAGLEDAKAIKVTVGSPAEPTDPNPVYVIGSLEPDDFSSFEVTCTMRGEDPVPLVIQYRDSEGTLFEKTSTVSIRTSTAGVPESGNPTGNTQVSTGQRRPGGFFGFGNGIGKIPVTEIVIVVVAAVLVLVAWRKGYLARAAELITKRRQG
jgi:hypothetical protein